MRKLARTISIAMVSTLVAGALLTGASSASSTQLPELPTISLDELLDIARIDLPPVGTTLQLNVKFPAEHPFSLAGLDILAITVNVSNDGDVETVSVIPSNAAAGKDGPQGAEGECSDESFKRTGPRWNGEEMPVVWRFRRNSMPDYLERVRTVFSLRRAHMVWPRIFTNCNDADDNTFAYQYAGPAKASRTMKYDKINLVDFGPLGGGALAVNYTWFTATSIVEVDLRFNRDEYKWTNVEKVKNAYQIQNVAAHELGHQFGLDDLTDPHGALTMFGRIGKGEMNKTTLGRGDMKGASILSP